MGLFSSSKKREALPWVNITSVEQLSELLHNIGEKPILLFKHSTRCGVSSMVLNSFENDWSSGTELCDIYYIDLLRHRDVSNEVAVLTGIIHQSPQAIVIKGKEIIYDATHSAIDARRIQSLLKKA
jgi:bacillithiol system protein YtxJ